MNILFLAASPLDYGRLRVNREGKEIREQLRNAKNSAQFNLLIEHATKVNDLQTLFLTHQPDIVHFSGHASKDGELVFEDEDGTGKPVSSSAIARLFTAFGKRIRCVIFNACYSELLRESIGQHVECVIGTTGLTDDNASICFSTAFYQALGYGESIERAYEWGLAAIELMGFDNTFVRYRHSDSLAHSTNYLSEPNSQIFLAGDLTKQDKHGVFEQSEFAQRDTSTSTKWLVGELNGDLVLMNRNNLVTDGVSHSESQSKAVAYYVSALGLIGDNELADRMRITRKIGACYRKNAQWDDAKRWLSEALDKIDSVRLERPELIVEYTRLQLEFAYCCADQSEFSIAAVHVNEVINYENDVELLKQFPTLHSEIGSAYNLRAIIAHEQYDFENFKKFQTRASENYALAGESDSVVDIELNRQYAEMQLGNYATTVSFYKKQTPEDLCSVAPDRLLRAYLNWILANLEAQNPTVAFEIASKAESYSGDKVDHIRIAIAFADAFKASAVSLSDHNSPDFENYRKRMIEKIGKGASLVEKLDASTIEAKLFKYQEKRLRAEWYTITGDYDLAEDEIRDAQSMYREIPETPDSIYVKCELDFVHTLLHKAKGQKSVALEKLLDLSGRLEQNYFFGKKVNIDIEIAELQIELGQSFTARKTLLRAEVLAQKYDRTHNIAKIETLMAQLKQ